MLWSRSFSVLSRRLWSFSPCRISRTVCHLSMGSFSVVTFWVPKASLCSCWTWTRRLSVALTRCWSVWRRVRSCAWVMGSWWTSATSATATWGTPWWPCSLWRRAGPWRGCCKVNRAWSRRRQQARRAAARSSMTRRKSSCWGAITRSRRLMQRGVRLIS